MHSPPTNPTADLLALARSGDVGAFSCLMEELQPRLVAQALAFCGDEDRAKDLVQETMIAAWKGLPRFDGSCRFFTWLYVILLRQHRRALGWADESRRFYADALQELPPLHATQDAYRGEKILADWLEHRFKAGGKQRQEAEAALSSMVARITPQDKTTVAAEFTPEAFSEALREFRSLNEKVARVLDQPWPQMQGQLKTLDDEATHSPNAIVRTYFPHISGVAEKQFVIFTLRTMLDAALRYGPQLDAVTAATDRDSFEAEPLQFKKSANGGCMLLTAHQHPAGKDLDLTLGK